MDIGALWASSDHLFISPLFQALDPSSPTPRAPSLLSLLSVRDRPSVCPLGEGVEPCPSSLTHTGSATPVNQS